MKTDDYLKLLIGDLVVQIAMLKAELDDMRARVSSPSPSEPRA